MFAYCNNNPINSADPSGHWPGISHKFNPNAMTYMSGRFYSGTSDKERAEEEAKRRKRQSRRFFNTDEQVVLDAEDYAFYKGQLVIKQDWGIANGRSGSFGIMFLHEDETRVETVQHEWGHYVQLRLLGPKKYATTVAIPSATSDPYDPYYYSNPWERTADFLGGVNRENYLSGSLVWGTAQMLFGPAAVLLYYITTDQGRNS